MLTQSRRTTGADMVDQVLELGWNISLLPTLIVQNQTKTHHAATAVNNQ